MLTQGHHLNFVELEFRMLHAKFQDHTISRSGEEDFLRLLPYMGMAATYDLDHLYIIFVLPSQRRLHIKFGFGWLSSFRGEEI